MIYELKSQFNFGKYKDTKTTIEEAIEDDLAYVEWCVQEIEFFKVPDEVFNLITLHHESMAAAFSDDDWDNNWDAGDMIWHEGYDENFGDR